MTKKKSAKKRKEIILKSDKSFEEMIDDAWNDKLPLKKGQAKTMVLVAFPGKLKKSTKKKSTKKRKK